MVRNDLPLQMREFVFFREVDASGTSGTGIVAEGVQFSDGTVAVRWRTEVASTAFYDSLEAVESIHSHGGNTKFMWVDDLCLDEDGTVGYIDNDPISPEEFLE